MLLNVPYQHWNNRNPTGTISFSCSWYSDTGDLGIVHQAMVSDLKNWREKYPLKPLMVTEYGADTISGE